MIGGRVETDKIIGVQQKGANCSNSALWWESWAQPSSSLSALLDWKHISERFGGFFSFHSRWVLFCYTRNQIIFNQITEDRLVRVETFCKESAYAHWDTNIDYGLRGKIWDLCFTINNHKRVTKDSHYNLKSNSNTIFFINKHECALCVGLQF